MSIQVRVPELGESISDALLVRWLKDDGATVRADEPIVELETDKSAMELVAEAAGRLSLRAQAGERVRVGQVLGEISEARVDAPPSPVAERAPAVERPPAAPAGATRPVEAPRAPRAPEPPCETPRAPEPPRETRRRRTSAGSCSGSDSAMCDHAPWLAGSSWAHTTSVALGYAASASRTCAPGTG